MAINTSLTNTQTDTVTTTWKKFADAGQNYLLTLETKGNILVSTSTSAPSSDDLAHGINSEDEVPSTALPATENMWYKIKDDMDEVRVSVTLWS